MVRIPRLYLLLTGSFLLAYNNLHAIELGITKESAMPLVQSLHYKQRLINNPSGIIRDSVTQPVKGNPFALISECRTADCSLCRATKEGGRARDHFENYVVGSLSLTSLTQKEVKKNPLLLSIGSGHLLPEARIAALAHQQGATSIEFHLIDIIYKEFVDAINATESSSKMFTIGTDAIDATHGNVSFYLEQFRQFVGFITSLYEGEAKIFIYPHVTSYPAKHLSMMPKPDLIIGCDPDTPTLDTFNKDVKTLLGQVFNRTCKGVFLYDSKQLCVIEAPMKAIESRRAALSRQLIEFNRIFAMISVFDAQGKE